MHQREARVDYGCGAVLFMKAKVLRSGLICILLITGSCIASRLNNSFDMKGPRGLGGYIMILITGAPPCKFDAASFDSCSFSR